MKIYRISEIEYLLDSHDHIQGGESAAVLARNTDDAWDAYKDTLNMFRQRRIYFPRYNAQKMVRPYCAYGYLAQDFDRNSPIKFRFYSSYSLKESTVSAKVRCEHMLVPDDVYDDVLDLIHKKYRSILVTGDWPACEPAWFNQYILKPCIQSVSKRNKTIAQESFAELDAYLNSLIVVDEEVYE